MPIAIVTGSAGLIGAETVRLFADRGLDIVGIDNDMRSYFFGKEASTKSAAEELKREIRNYKHEEVDIRDWERISGIFSRLGKDVSVVIHTAAQPSHDWAAREPFTDFGINATGTLNILEATRQFCPEAVLIFTSTNKVYGDAPNLVPLRELELRYEPELNQPCAEHGFDENFTIDQSTHSIFGASKVAADILTQEYGRYFGMKTGTFRGGCLTGPTHAGAPLHGFLAYLIKCGVSCAPYTVLGYKGKQVRDNIHAHDLVEAFWQFFRAPRAGEVYNIGGGRFSNCSMLEAIAAIERLTGKPMKWSYKAENRIGDHIWYVSDTRKFAQHYPAWKQEYDINRIIDEMVQSRMHAERAAV